LGPPFLVRDGRTQDPIVKGIADGRFAPTGGMEDDMVTWKEFPAGQKPGSFNLNRVPEKLPEATGQNR
jgi:hypothetical protein